MSKKNTQPADWGQSSSEIKLTPEQIIDWLESYRELMIEVWNKNPELRKEWERLNKDKAS